MTNIVLFLVLLFFSNPAISHGEFHPKPAIVEKVASADLWKYSADVVWPPTGTGAYTVCVDEANVYGGPDADRMVRYTLPRGTEVNVRERAKWVSEGWAMIKQNNITLPS